MNKRTVISLFVLCILVVMVSACAPKTSVAPTAAVGAPEQPAGTSLDGKAILERTCTVCHDLTRVTTKAKTFEEWQSTVTRMIGNGAVLSSDEEKLLVQYLADTYK
jgi:cytochrome c5